MARKDLTFRVFVSSTFSDLKAERNALQQNTFPRLRKYCAERNARFQAIDLRWGVSQEAALDQKTMDICFGRLPRRRRQKRRIPVSYGMAVIFLQKTTPKLLEGIACRRVQEYMFALNAVRARIDIDYPAILISCLNVSEDPVEDVYPP